MTTYVHTSVDGPVLHKTNRTTSISEWLGLTTFHGTPAVVVEAVDAKKQIVALLDLLSLRLAGHVPATSSVAVLLHAPHPEAVAALEVLRDAVADEVEVNLLQCDCSTTVGSLWLPVPPAAFDTADPQYYPRWPGLLAQDFTPPRLVAELLDLVELDELRAYPQLTATGEWSIRLEGLQIGRITRRERGYLDVGSIGKYGALGYERSAWLAIHPSGAFRFDDTNLDQAASMIIRFAEAWTWIAGGTQNEHVLESRILRGRTTVGTGRGALEPVRPDPHINWGSQFPTKWGPVRSARYLDALLRDPIDPTVPWAIEMKVRLSEGQYYRHAVAQAVLYRHFIKKAESLHFWFKPYGLDPQQCRAAVVVPTFTTPAWEERLRGLCELFDVELVVVDEEHTLR